MLGLSESFLASKNFTLIAVAMAFLAASLLFSVIFRFAYGRRLRLPRNGRTRLPRLGTVDAFDLDRQRQLVIIRRDNVEHLLLIGGPNDLLIESQIIRAESREPRDFREARLRDKDAREKEPRDAPSTPWPSPAETAPPVPPQRKMPYPPAATTAWEPENAAAAGVPGEEPAAGRLASTVAPTPRLPAFQTPPKRASSSFASSGQRPQIQREPLPGRAAPSQGPESVAGLAKEFPRTPLTASFLRSSVPRQAERNAVKLVPTQASETPAVITHAPPAGEEKSLPSEVSVAAGTAPLHETSTIMPIAPASAAGDEGQDAPATDVVQAGADILELEMAKLLRRGPG